MADWTQIPELVLETLGYFESSPSTLFACAQVNGLWAEVSTTLLWKHIESVKFFSCIGGSSDRCRYYARKVRTIGFWRWSRSPSWDSLIPPNSIHPGLCNMDFSGVWGVSSMALSNVQEDDLFPYLNCSLRTLAVNGRNYSGRLLRHLQTNCTALTHLRLGAQCALTPSELIRVALDIPLIHLDWPSMLKWTSDDFIQLGASLTLQSLCYAGREFHESRLLVAAAVPSPLFPALRQLKMAAIYERGSLSRFSLIPSLGKLHLSIRMTPDSHFLRFLTSSSIRHLQISVTRGPLINRDDLFALVKGCPLLETLDLENHRSEDPPLASADEDPDAIIDLVQHAPNLHSLRIYIQAAFIDIDMFETFDLVPRRRHKFLSLQTPLKTSSIHRHRYDTLPLFPCLERLAINNIEMDMYIRPSRLVKYLARAAPRLKELNFMDGSGRQSRRVKRKWDGSHKMAPTEMLSDQRRRNFFYDGF